ncbi:hypothetical protein MIMGU_mgv11b018858mg [Erythranthe guttata]|uniref:Peptidase C1A papain C-terminal domain-containing protein n=1 Tax=Erythranthe guttata TaxID=4155 RepID=A0A022S029_ERYGU|nr:hypothetical protein MIMGU_mgv11b018858mg [Erythranthe guttata]
MRFLARGPIVGTMEVYESFSKHKEGLEEGRFHSVLLVGGSDDEVREKHYEVHNSWGDGWTYRGGAKVAGHLIRPYYNTFGKRLVQPDHQITEMRIGVPVEELSLNNVFHYCGFDLVHTYERQIFALEQQQIVAGLQYFRVRLFECEREEYPGDGFEIEELRRLRGGAEVETGHVFAAAVVELSFMYPFSN